MRFVLVTFVLMLWSQSAFSYFTYNASVTTGKMEFLGEGKESFTESQVGLTYAFNPTLSIQATAIARFVENDENYYGGQVVVPVSSRLLSNQLSLRAYLAPGFRVLRGYEAPIMEGGVSVGLSGIRLGLGYRAIFNEAFDNGLGDESQIFFFGAFNGFL